MPWPHKAYDSEGEELQGKERKSDSSRKWESFILLKRGYRFKNAETSAQRGTTLSKYQASAFLFHEPGLLRSETEETLGVCSTISLPGFIQTNKKRKKSLQHTAFLAHTPNHKGQGQPAAHTIWLCHIWELNTGIYFHSPSLSLSLRFGFKQPCKDILT